MVAYGEPDWATPGAAASGAAAPAPIEPIAPVNTGASNQAATVDRSKTWHRLISIGLICLCAAMCALGVFAILDNFNVNDFTEWFIAAYMILFSVLLFLYELLWWCTIGPLNRVIRKNFGFIYKVRGKALYLIFVSCLCIGIDEKLLGSMDWLRWVSGIGWGVAGLALLILSFTNAPLFENYYVPTKGFKDENAASDGEFNETV